MWMKPKTKSNKQGSNSKSNTTSTHIIFIAFLHLTISVTIPQSLTVVHITYFALHLHSLRRLLRQPASHP